MNKNRSIIHLNGQAYDAQTGQPLGAGRNVDGVRASKRQADALLAAVLPAATSVKPQPITKTPVMDIARPGVNHVAKHAPEHAKTLMRTTVKKPAITAKPHVKAHGSLAASAVAVTSPLAKHSVTVVHPERQKRSASAVKSPQIKHFHAGSQYVAPPAAAPAISTPPDTAVETAPQHANDKAVKPSLDIFEKALQQATAHEQPLFSPPHKHRKRTSHRWLSGVSAVLCLVLVGGFLVYRNVPSINLHLASARAGFTAVLPAYEPSGFSLARFISNRGEVVVRFQSNSDQRTYTVTEKTSDWDSLTLRDGYVTTQAGQNFETITSGGNTIYVYGQNNATWVSGGIWYVVQSNGALSTKQLVDIANSL